MLLRILLCALVIVVARPGIGWADTGTSRRAPVDISEDARLYSCGKVRGKVTIRFKPDVKLKELVAWAMGFSCKNFVFAKGVGGRSAQVTIIAPKKMSRAQAWRLFLVALRSMNLAVVAKGHVLELVEAPQAKGHALSVRRRAPASSERMTRMLMRPEHISVDELAAALTALKSAAGDIVTLSRAGVVLITDYGSHVSKMAALARQVDRPLPGEKLYAIRVKHVDAVELADKLREILKAPTTAPAPRRPARRGRRKARASTSAPSVHAIPSNLVADGRTNTLFVLATKPAYRRVRAVVIRLDVPIAGEKVGHIHIYKLQNSDAEELSGSLNQLLTGNKSSAASKAARRPPTPSAGSHPSLEGEVRMGFDKPSNALMFIASMRDYLALKQIIKTLDKPRKQVYVEVTILEVETGSGFELGTTFHGGRQGKNGSVIIGGLQHKDFRSADVKGTLAKTGALGGIVGSPLAGAEKFLGTTIPSFGAFFQAISGRSDLEVLSTPHILTANHEPAEISSGENIPFKSGVVGGDITGTQPQFQPVQRQKVALTLKLTPHINASNIITLDVDLAMQGLKKDDFEGLGASWTEHSIKNTVMVHDQESVVIGGLVKESNERRVSKVPLLGDVPILGHLFRNTVSEKKRTNILVILTPHLVANNFEAHRIMQRRLRERREFLRSSSVLRGLRYRTSVDYGRKRGVIEEINRAVRRAESDAAEMRKLEQRAPAPPDGEVVTRR